MQKGLLLFYSYIIIVHSFHSVSISVPPCPLPIARSQHRPEGRSRLHLPVAAAGFLQPHLGRPLAGVVVARPVFSRLVVAVLPAVAVDDI
ncbi:hypothetical protein B0T17DRAFT_213508 [Bombardia bombarda]|uniref:Secreted protein n=1 Tax=Bombardia bombarda TaxID=252184 RepID=A0AA39XA64_9PEZI|nr:hypothetical protein B0T17DRAFT_213508 [Bombardia bombarda]